MEQLKSLTVAAVATFTLTFMKPATALTDAQALEAGMMPMEDYLVSELKSTVTPGLNTQGVARATESHRLVIAINKATKGADAQTLRIFENGMEILKEKISTGREMQEKAKSGKVYFSATPKGFFRPTRLYVDYMSNTWKSPMPNAVFFIGGIAIHATDKSQYPHLGTRASGGCIRTKLATSRLIREKIMETGRGKDPGQFKLIQEAPDRSLIGRNTVLVDGIHRRTGDMLNSKLRSWDTVIIVYEEENRI